MTTQYEEQPSLPFTTEELGTFHKFHSYKWDEDKSFQAGLETITQTQPNPSEASLLKIKQYYFSTRLGTRIDLDHYLDWRKRLEPPTDDPAVPVFKRFDAYNFDTDARFQKGLPTLISQLVKEGKNALDKEGLQKEMTKAKAFYYTRFVESFDLLAYLNWKEMAKSQQGPACPYAHLWQKGKGAGSELPDDPRQFVTTKAPVSTGALQLHMHSPGSQNRLTTGRMAKLSKTIVDAVEDDTVTSIFWTVNSGVSSLHNRDPDSQIVTKDEKWFCGGVIAPNETEFLQKQDALRQYYTLVDQVLNLSQKSEKPVVMVVDGMVALSSAYLAFAPMTGQVVISENAALAFTPSETLRGSAQQVENPFAGLYLLALIQSGCLETNAVRPLAKGTGLYLAFNPDYILRGPDLKKLGLANYFIPSKKTKDVEESVLAVAGCPPPHTAKAVRMALNAEVEYPGPAKIDVWRDEVAECFGESSSLEDAVSRLEKYKNKWSKDIRNYIASLDPLLAKLIYKAVLDASKLETFEEIVRLEYRLFTRYSEHKSSGKSEDMDLDCFFEPLDGEAESELFKFSFENWVKEGGAETEQADLERELAAEASLKAGAAAGESAMMPADHPMVPGMTGMSSAEMADAAAKGCPHFAAQLGASKDTATATLPPADHPMVPGMANLSAVDMADAAAKGCPHFAAQLSKESTEAKTTTTTSAPSPTTTTTTTTAIPADHPMVPGMTGLTLEAMADAAAKGCPHFAAVQNKASSVTASEQTSTPMGATIPSDHPPVPGMADASMCPVLRQQAQRV
ncbi:hypothetical protein DFQ27_003122 [Actinomortierella ambigua]|uniref:Uncharacterized protein n=1 Tax=Actinomortierella ambigua TaxID=1343610 RepID=A0A9P6U5Z9_9FUNG|nr:hypothetical protein DFQ27_003122 [Actinomortierella ambigua]